MSKWILPPDGCIKLNFDGASKGNPGTTGFSCVLRDHSSKVICALYGPLGVCDSSSTKVMDLCELKRFVVPGRMVEANSEVVIGWGLGRAWDSGANPLLCMKSRN